jgi:hypothetical protein
VAAIFVVRLPRQRIVYGGLTVIAVQPQRDGEVVGAELG